MTQQEHAAAQSELTPELLAEIERKYDPELAFRPTGRTIAIVISTALVAMAVYHFYVAGFALIRELLHRGIHLAELPGSGLARPAQRLSTPCSAATGRCAKESGLLLPRL